MFEKLSKFGSSLKRIMDVSADNIKKSIDGAFNVKNKVFTRQENRAAKREMLLLGRSLRKFSRSRIVSNDVRSYIKAFENADWDPTKLKERNVKNSLTETYEDFMELKKVGKLPKNTMASFYCEAYDFMSGKHFATLFRDAKKSKYFNKNKLSSEALKGFESLEMYLTEASYGQHERSEEFLQGVFTRSLIASGITASITNLNIVLILIAIAMGLAITLLIIMFIHMSEIRKDMASYDNDPDANIEDIRKEAVARSIDKIESKVNIVTKNALIKPCIAGVTFINKLSSDAFAKLDNVYNDLEQKVKERKQLSKEDVNELSMEAGFGVATIITIGAVAAILLLIVPLVRALMYYIHHFRFSAYDWLKEQSVWTANNIQAIRKQLEDPNTPESEKKRLEGIIKKQEKWVERLNKASDSFYKEQTTTGSNVRDEIMEEDSGKVQNEIDKEFEKDPETSYKISNNEPDTDSGAPHNDGMIFLI